MRIAYAAHTDSCTFFLDEEGYCRRVLRRRGLADEGAAQRCIGAQYVASLDFETRGGLVAMPQVGAPMLFAYVDENSRIALVRTGAVRRFEPAGATKPDSGVRERPSDQFETHPEMAPAEPSQSVDVPMDDEDASEEENASTTVFRSSRPPRMGSVPPLPRPSLLVSPATPPLARAGARWVPPTRIERVSVTPPPPPSTTRVHDPAALTQPTPTAAPPRGKGMLPVRASRGRG